jgi:hypothetical protein
VLVAPLVGQVLLAGLVGFGFGFGWQGLLFGYVSLCFFFQVFFVLLPIVGYHLWLSQVLI